MDALITLLMNKIAAGGPGILAVLGWGLYFIERYHVSPSKEKQYSAELAKARENYTTLSERTTETLAKFSVILEVIKDRMVR